MKDFLIAKPAARGTTQAPIRLLMALLLAGLLLAGFAGGAMGQYSDQVKKDIEVLRRASKARAAIVKVVSPSVVHISVEKVVHNGPEEGEDPFDDEFFRRFFAPRMPFPPKPDKQRGLGSGSIVDKKGYVLTNNHVIEDADKIIVKLKDGREFEAKLVGADPASDLAVVKVDAKDLPVASLGNSDQLEVGETVLAIGNPFGLEQTVTQGIVSAKGRSSVGVTDYEDFIQTDAPINPGNSGGPMINLDGEIVGVNTAIFSRTGGNMGIGFAIPINMARKIMDQLIASGRVVRGYLGVVIQEVTPELAPALGLSSTEGVLIANIGPDSPALKAGMERGDVVTTFNGKKVNTTNELRNTVAAVSPGAVVPVEVVRKGKKITLKVQVGEQPGDMRAAIEGREEPGEQEAQVKSVEEKLGMEVANLTRDIAAKLNYRGQKGVVITGVDPQGISAEAGLREGMLIQEVNKVRITSIKEFRKVLDETPGGKHLLLLVRAGQTSRFFGLKKP
ncbi:MAG: DegQ family serine endoprotease [Deltaproteobacteria bacterium]|nr:DegQ family serine endoprotease [Deltaproteobacteria bacterium]